MEKIKKVLYKFEMEAIILRSLLSWCDPPPPPGGAGGGGPLILQHVVGGSGRSH